MNRRAVGFGFIAISAFLFASRYICASLYGMGRVSWSADLYHVLFVYVGPDLTIAAEISLLIGIVYLLIGERSESPGSTLPGG